MAEHFAGGNAQNIYGVTKITEAMMVETSNQPTEPCNVLAKYIVLTASGELSDVLVNSHIIRLMALWGKEKELMRMFLHNPFQNNPTVITEADTPDPLSAVTTLSRILGGEAQGYRNRVLTVAHMVQLHTAYENVVKARIQER
jgi:hypothetical protein